MSEIKVIGAGFGRTGTLTIKAALEELGFGPCYHMKEVFLKRKIPEWCDLANENLTQAEKLKKLKSALEGYQASVDFPSSVYFEEQMTLYPNAKVLLSVRDNPQVWVKSVKSTVFGSEMGNRDHLMFMPWFTSLMTTVPIIRWILPIHMKDKMKKGFSKIFLGREQKWDEETMAKVYLDWIEHVKRIVPKEKLLIYNVKEGWEPLCKFLEVEVPKSPMPRVNDSAQWKQRQRYAGAVFSLIIVLWYSFLIFCLCQIYTLFQ